MLPDEIGQAPAEAFPESAQTQVPATAIFERVPFWGYEDLLLVLGLLIASVVVMGALVGLLLKMFPKMQDDSTPLLLPTQVALYVVIYLIFRLVFGLKYHKPVFRSLGWRRTSTNLGFAAVGGVLLAFALSPLAYVLHTPTVDPFEKLLSSRVILVLFGIIAITIAPLFEELFFRGFIQPLLSRTFGPLAGVVGTAVLFGSLHGPEYSWAWQYALFISLVGAALGWLRARSNSIVPSTVMHGCFNAVSFVGLLLSKTTK